MTDPAAKLKAIAGRLRELGGVAEDCAPRVAERLHELTDEQIARGVGPDGEPWPPTKAGKRPLNNAAKAVSHTAVGTVAIVRVEGPEARHHAGTARGHVVRRILPTRRLSAPATEAVRDVIRERFGEIAAGEGAP